MSEQPPVAAPRARLVAHAVLAGVGLAAIAISLRLGLWRQSCVAALVRDWIRSEPARPRAAGDRTGLIRVGAYLGALVFYAVSLEFLGFIVATAITITFILRFAERYPWAATLALTAGTVIGCQVLFVLWLGAMLPTGTLWADVLQ
jgi:hypothetical protein